MQPSSARHGGGQEQWTRQRIGSGIRICGCGGSGGGIVERVSGRVDIFLSLSLRLH